MQVLATLICVTLLSISTVQSRLLAGCECGIGNLEDIDVRIIAGRVASPHAFPWIIYLWHKRFQLPFCGGAIINDLYILTAGHCIFEVRAPDILVRVGAHDVHAQDGIGMQVARLIMHDTYKRYPSYDTDDLALIKTKHRIQFNNFVLPICLPNPNSDYTRANAIISGWGKTDNGTAARYLMHSNVRVMSDDECFNAKSVGDRIMYGLNLCAFGYKTDTCQGDSGSPLVYEVMPYKYQIIGVVSWGEGCAPDRRPGVYVKVSKYLHWIQRNTQDANYCRVEPMKEVETHQKPQL